jgi:hypothetical protein
MHTDLLLRLDEGSLEDVDEVLAPSRVERVLAELEHRAALV